MRRLVGFSRFAALLEEQISDKISRRILSGDQGMIVRRSESGPEASHATDKTATSERCRRSYITSLMPG